jgi:nitrogen fixation NifU-like protein
MSASAVHSLYDGLILDHIKNARNYRALEPADRVAEGVNPLCGDSFTI